MIKTIFKVLYISLAVVLAIVVFVFNYQSTTINQISDALNGFVKREEYYNVARMCGGLYDSNPVISIQNETTYDEKYSNKMQGTLDFYNEEINPSNPKSINASTVIEDNKYDMIVYSGTKDVTKTYYNHGDEENLEKAEYHKYDFAYYIYIFDSKINFNSGSAQINKKKINVNNTAIRFYKTETEYFDYYAIVSDDVYQEVGEHIYETSYIAKPDNSQDMFLRGERNLLDSYDKWGFYDFTVTMDSIIAINGELGGTDDNNVITSFAIIDRNGDEVENSKCNFTFSFDEEFFQDGNAKIIYDAYKKYNDVADNPDSSDSDKSDAEDLFRDEAKVFDENMKEGLYPTYFKAFDKSDIVKTSTVVWKSILVVTLFIFSATVVFILVFKFTWIKGLIFRKKEGHYVPNKEKARQTAERYQAKQQNQQTLGRGQRLPRGQQKQAIAPIAANNVAKEENKNDNINDKSSEKNEEVKEEKVEETPVVEETKVEETPVVEETQETLEATEVKEDNSEVESKEE